MTKRQNVIPLDMNSPAKTLPEPQQIELFTSWFAAEGEEDNSRTLAFWDLLPWASSFTGSKQNTSQGHAL